MDERPLDDELGEFLKALQRRWYIVLGAIVQFAVLAYLLSSLQTPIYRASTTVLLEPSAAQQTIDPGSTNNNGIRGRNITNEIYLATSGDVLVELARNIGETDTVVLERRLSVVGDSESDLLVFTVTDVDPDVAASTANLWASLYVVRSQSEAAESLDDATTTLEARLADLQQQRADLRADLNVLLQTRANTADPDEQARLDSLIQAELEAIATEDAILDAQINSAATNIIELGVATDLATSGTARVVSEAVPPKEPSNVAPARNMAIAIILGGIVGLVAVRFLSRRDDRISSANEIEAELHLPVLASIPKPPRALHRRSELALAAAEHPDELISEAYNQLRTSISYLQNDKARRAVIVTSATPGEGKTTTAANVALTSAMAGTRTMLLDVDLRRPRLHQAFSLSLRPGFVDVVKGDVEPDVARHQFEDLPLSVITAGTPTRNVASLIGGERAVNLINNALEANELVVLDTPPLLAVSDAASIGSTMNAVCVVVVRSGATTLADVRETVKRMERVGTEVVGVILTGVKPSKASGRSYYGTSEGHTRDEPLKLMAARKGESSVAATPPPPLRDPDPARPTTGRPATPVQSPSSDVGRREAAARAAASRAAIERRDAPLGPPLKAGSGGGSSTGPPKKERDSEPPKRATAPRAKTGARGIDDSRRPKTPDQTAAGTNGAGGSKDRAAGTARTTEARTKQPRTSSTSARKDGRTERPHGGPKKPPTSKTKPATTNDKNSAKNRFEPKKTPSKKKPPRSS